LTQRQPVLSMATLVAATCSWCAAATQSMTCIKVTWDHKCPRPGWYRRNQGDCCLPGDWHCWKCTWAKDCTGGNTFVDGAFGNSQCCRAESPWDEAAMKCINVNFASDCNAPGFYRRDQDDCCLEGEWDCWKVTWQSDCTDGGTFIKGAYGNEQCCRRRWGWGALSLSNITTELNFQSARVASTPQVLGTPPQGRGAMKRLRGW